MWGAFVQRGLLSDSVVSQKWHGLEITCRRLQGHPRFGDLLGLAGLGTESYAWVWFTGVEGHKAKSFRREGVWSEVWRRPGWSFQESPQQSHTGCAKSLQQQVLTTHAHYCLPETWCWCFHWGLLMGAPASWHESKFQTPRRRAGVQCKPHCLYTQLGRGEPLLSGNSENSPQVHVPGHPPRANLANFLRMQSSYENTFLHTPSAPRPKSSLPQGLVLLDSDTRSVYPQTTQLSPCSRGLPSSRRWAGKATWKIPLTSWVW